ncbi:MAG: M23 family metallopeptidase, partial [Anaerolineae bacterium]|nr:M23 family metallopeptidase [Anaerolineae bacterium]
PPPTPTHTYTPIPPTPTPIPVNGEVPPAGVWVNDIFIDAGCAPAGMPAAGPLTQRFHSAHIGIDIGVHIGTPILATHSGQVIFAGWSDRGYGNLVVVKNNSFITYYGHFDSFSVVEGQWVPAGAVLGLSGNTGNSTGPHLHYETRINDIPVDPLTFEARGYRHC